MALTTPDKLESRLGVLEFNDGLPIVGTAAKVCETLDFTNSLDAYRNSYGGASAFAIRQGVLGIVAEASSMWSSMANVAGKSPPPMTL